MNKAICWKSDQHFTGHGTEYVCSEAFSYNGDAAVKVTDNHGEEIIVSINDPDFDFVFRSRTHEQWCNKLLLEEKGFHLNEYTEGRFWELVVKNDKNLKEKICEVFGTKVNLLVEVTDIETLILQCREDFTGCLFYYDCTAHNMETEDFLNCVRKI